MSENSLVFVFPSEIYLTFSFSTDCLGSNFDVLFALITTFFGREDYFFFSVLYFGFDYYAIVCFLDYIPSRKGYLFGFIFFKSDTCLFKRPKELTEKIDLLLVSWASMFKFPELYFGEILWAYGNESFYLLRSLSLKFWFYLMIFNFYEDSFCFLKLNLTMEFELLKFVLLLEYFYWDLLAFLTINFWFLNF